MPLMGRCNRGLPSWLNRALPDLSFEWVGALTGPRGLTEATHAVGCDWCCVAT
jgi:hypothetical protein